MPSWNISPYLILAFLLAGGIVTFVLRDAIIGYLGAAAGKVSSFGIAVDGSFFVAACSCTVIPVSGLPSYSSGWLQQLTSWP
ncbi:permease [Dehalococcoidia bacterium]|nr:permease [Dehalococcoidia bacterium]